VGDSPPGPRAGIRIVSVEQSGAGPFGTLVLADLGAEVIQIEDLGTGGEISRYVPPDAILESTGYSEGDIEAFKAAGAMGTSQGAG
jgi:crotonobetainyl-CoA:carnitine CoA-transferase CaiB-like acyl-CoA transferase